MFSVASNSSSLPQSYREVPNPYVEKAGSRLYSDLDAGSDSDSGSDSETFGPVKKRARYIVSSDSRLEQLKSEMTEQRKMRILNEFAANEGNSSYQVVVVSEQGEKPSNKRHIVHRTASERNEVISTTHAVAAPSLNAGVTSSVHPVENGPETIVKHNLKYVYRFAEMDEDGEYSRDYLNEMQILSDLDQLNKKYEGLRPVAHCIVLHPELGIGCLDKRFERDLLNFIGQPDGQRFYNFITLQLMKGLGTLLAHDIVHTDLKADNVLVETIEGIIYAYHADFGKTLYVPKDFRGNSEAVIDDIKNTADKIDESPFPGGNSLEIDLNMSQSLADRISNSENLRELKTLYAQLREIVQKRMLFSLGVVLYEMYSGFAIDPSKDPDDTLSLESITGKDFYSPLKASGCPEILANLIVRLLKPLNQRISVDTFIREVNVLRLLSDEIFLPEPAETETETVDARAGTPKDVVSVENVVPVFD